MTTKKPYEKPAMQVFMLKQQPQLLQASASATIDDYDDGEFTW